MDGKPEAIGKTIYHGEEEMTVNEYLEKNKDSVVHFRSMMNHFGINDLITDLPNAIRRSKYLTVSEHTSSRVTL